MARGGGRGGSLLWTYFFISPFCMLNKRLQMDFIQNAPFCSLLLPPWPKSWRTDRLLIESGEWWLSRWPLTLSETKDFLFWRCGDKEEEEEKKNIWKPRSSDGLGHHPLRTFLKSEKPYFFFFAVSPFVSPCTCQKSCSATSVNRSCHCHLCFFVFFREAAESHTAGSEN